MDQDFPQPNPENQQRASVETQVYVDSDAHARQWAMFCHLAALAQFVLPSLGNVIGPLIVWLVKKDQHPFINDQGKEALNFQISMSLYIWLFFTVSAMLVCVFIGIFLLFIAAGVLGIWTVADVVLAIIAGIKANNGEAYRYPMTIRFLK